MNVSENPEPGDLEAAYKLQRSSSFCARVFDDIRKLGWSLFRTLIFNV